MDLAVTSVVVNLGTGDRFRVLWKAHDNSYGYWINLNDKTRIPEKFIIEEMDYANYESTEDGEIAEIISESDIPDYKKEHRDKIWEMLSVALKKEPDIYDKKTRRKILLEIQEQNGISATNIYHYLARYWKKGKTKNAFIPEFSKRGGKGNSRKQSKKIGRPSEKTVFGKILTDGDRICFAKAVKKYYLTKNEYPFQAVYELLLRDYYSIKVTNPDGKDVLKLLSPDEIPSKAQFYYWYKKQRDFTDEKKKRTSEATFALSGRSVLGKSDYGLIGPGSKYQIDATVGDIYLVSQFDNSSIIGRPVMYFVVDAFSRMVTGMYIGLEGPSWIGMMMAISNAACNKVKYCAEYGVEITENLWPCHHVPTAILGDRGELMSKNADSLVSMLGIRIENAPSYRADLKGIIEQHFRTINVNATMFLPGRVKNEIKKRGGKDYRLDAKLDIRQFTQIIIKCVLFYNNNHYMDYLEKSEQMIADNVEAVPIKLWEWGTQNRSGELRSFPEEKIKLALMPKSKGSVTGKGLYFKGVYYTCNRAIDEQWFEKARVGKSFKVDVSYDPRNMENIYAKKENDTTFEFCRLLDWGSKYAGKHLDEIIFEQEKEKHEKKRLQANELEAKINLSKEIDEVIAAAESTLEPLKGKSKAAQISGIRDNRKAEKDALRRQESFTKNESLESQDSNTYLNAASTLSDNEYISPISEMIKRKLEERLNPSE